MAPLATKACRRFLAVAPRAPSRPSPRRRRCAITEKPATATKPTKIDPSTASSMTISAACCASPCGGIDTWAPSMPRPWASSGEDTLREHRHGEWRRDAPWRDDREVRREVERILDDTHDVPGVAVDGPRGTNAQAEFLEHAVGDGNLIRRRRETAGVEAHRLGKERAVRRLVAQVNRRDRAGYGNGAVVDNLNRPPFLREFRDVLGQRRACAWQASPRRSRNRTWPPSLHPRSPRGRGP